MMQAEPILAVKHVPASAKWYAQLLGCQNQHTNDSFAILANAEGQVLLCLHPWEAHGHPTMQDSSLRTGHGLLLYFRTPDLAATRRRATELACQIEEEVHLNPNTNCEEFSLRDPDGYYLTVSAFHWYGG